MKIRKLTTGQRLCVQMADLNRLRWLSVALGTNEALWDASPTRDSIRSSQTHIVDSISLLSGKAKCKPGSWIVLWDGYNSFTELMHHNANSIDSLGVVWLYVGHIADVRNCLSANSVRLYSDSAYHSLATTPFSLGQYSWPVASREVLSRLRTRFRSARNRHLDSSRHRKLKRDRQIVFCGALTPTVGWARDAVRGSRLSSLGDMCLSLASIWQDGNKTGLRLMGNVYKALSSTPLITPEDICAAYSILNILHRLCVISILKGMHLPLFLNEYGISKHLDPYDALCYSQNLFIEFGSQRGVDLLYPRTVDLIRTRKKFTSLRLLGNEDKIVSFFSTVDAQSFVEICESQAQAVGEQFRFPEVDASLLRADSRASLILAGGNESGMESNAQ